MRTCAHARMGPAYVHEWAHTCGCPCQHARRAHGKMMWNHVYVCVRVFIGGSCVHAHHACLLCIQTSHAACACTRSMRDPAATTTAPPGTQAWLTACAQHLHTDAYMDANITSYINAFLHSFIHAYMHRCIHSCIPTFTHSYIHTFGDEHTQTWCRQAHIITMSRVARRERVGIMGMVLACLPPNVTTSHARMHAWAWANRMRMNGHIHVDVHESMRVRSHGHMCNHVYECL